MGSGLPSPLVTTAVVPTMGGMTMPADDHPTRFVRALTARLLDDQAVEAFWLEGRDDSILWPPFAQLDLHLAVPEPFLAGLRERFAEHLRACDAVTGIVEEPAPFKGFTGSAVLSDGTPLRYRLERTSQLAKVPRAVVNVLIDKTGGLLFPSLSFRT